MLRSVVRFHLAPQIYPLVRGYLSGSPSDRFRIPSRVHRAGETGPQQVPYGFGGRSVGFVRCLGVYAQRDLRVGVAHTDLGCLHVDASRHQSCGRRFAEVMEAKVT
jgi:hypothetical protein